jgi:uncharacterized protein (DUF2336 family)
MMIVRDFLRWLNSAPASDRAEAAGALARTYLCSDLEADAIAVAEDLMLKLVDDPSPLVRRALADALAASPVAPPVVVMALTADQPQIAAPVYALSPLLVDADLLDAVATGGEMIQVAIASRAVLPSVVAAALAELGNAEACLILTENHPAQIAPSAIERMVERFGDDAVIRAALLARDDLPAATRQNLVTKVSETIAGFVVGRSWLEADRARRITREACDKATVIIAAESPKAELRPLIRHLCGSGQLTAGFMLRALLSGNLALFEEGMAELSGMPVRRVSGLVRDHFGAGLPALLKKAQLPPSTHVAFKEAIAAMRDDFARDAEGVARLQRRTIERVLTRYEDADVGEVASLLTLLRRFATEAARDEARKFCHELVCDEVVCDELAAEPPAIAYSAAA